MAFATWKCHDVLTDKVIHVTRMEINNTIPEIARASRSSRKLQGCSEINSTR